MLSKRKELCWVPSMFIKKKRAILFQIKLSSKLALLLKCWDINVWEGAIRKTVFTRAFMTCLLIWSLKPFLQAGNIIVPALSGEKLRLKEEAEVSDCGRLIQALADHFIPQAICSLTIMSWAHRAKQLGPFILRLCHLIWSWQKSCQIDKVLPLLINRWGKKPRER